MGKGRWPFVVEVERSPARVRLEYVDRGNDNTHYVVESWV